MDTPTVAITSDDGDGRFAVGEPIRLRASASDQEDGQLTISWKSTEVHCPSTAACHAHPGPARSGRDYSIPFTSHPDTRVEITATATDSAGVSRSATYVASPRQHPLTLRSNTAATLRAGTDGTASTLVTAGSQVSISAADTALDGVATFDRWSNGRSSRTATVTMPDDSLTLTATYLTPIDRRFAAEPWLATAIGAPVGPEIAEGPIRYRDHEHGRLYWSAETGVHEMHGAILSSYKSLGAHGFFGVPTTDETSTPDGVGRYNHFAGHNGQNGSIYWTPRTGAHDVYGAIWDRWAALGWERSYLGYPISGEHDVPGGRRSDFERGFIRWGPVSGTTDRPY